MSKWKYWLFASVASALMNACQKVNSLLNPEASGNPFEVMVVADDSLFEDEVGTTIKSILNTPVPGLPQREPSFHVSHVEEKHYDRITHLFRNIVLIHIGREHTVPKIILERDVFADNQFIVTFVAPDNTTLIDYVNAHRDFIVNLIVKEEMSRLANYYDKRHNRKFDERVRDMFGCSFHIPGELNHFKEGKDFIWATNDALTGVQSVAVYSYPYTTNEALTLDSIIAVRDSVMKINIPGGQPGQYMTTNKETVHTDNILARNVYAKEVRGLWEIENDNMGGPFVAHCVIDTIRHRIIVGEAFVYAPEKAKRTMMRTLEASLYTLKVIEKADEEEE